MIWNKLDNFLLVMIVKMVLQAVIMWISKCTYSVSKKVCWVFFLIFSIKNVILADDCADVDDFIFIKDPQKQLFPGFLAKGRLFTNCVPDAWRLSRALSFVILLFTWSYVIALFPFQFNRQQWNKESPGCPSYGHHICLLSVSITQSLLNNLIVAQIIYLLTHKSSRNYRCHAYSHTLIR